MELQYILFDLDGTLTNSEEGIIKCVRYALDKLGREIPGEEDLLKFIGPPLVDSFRDIMGMTKEEEAHATAVYRERYNVTGLFENKVYDGMEELLRTLSKEGYHLAVATSKPQMPTEEILKHFHLDTYFEVIVGSSLDHTRDTKTAVMLEALKQLGVDSEDKKKKALMIGDRKFDILGAKECGIASLGVYYGFAPANELEENGADYIVQQVPEILETIHRLS